MDCPECGAALVTYRLDDREAPVCEQCGHVGIDAEHRPARLRVESWGEALRRFYGTDDDAATVPLRGPEWEPSKRARVETWTTALERFYRGTDAESNGDREESGERPTGESE
jgi:hypothetical protein